MTRLAAMFCIALLITSNATGHAQNLPQPTPEDVKLHGALSEMFEAGIGPRRSASLAQAAYDRAKRIAPGDPRVTYAWGLILLRRLKREEALEALIDASDRGFFRGRQAAIWYLLSKSKTQADGLREAKALASQLAESNDPNTREERLAVAQWLSEALSASGRTTGKKVIKDIEATEVEIRKVLDAANLGEAWAPGRVAVQNRFDAQTKTNEQRAAEAAKKAEADSKNTIARLDKRMQNVKKSNKESEVDKSDLRAAVHDVLARIATEFGRLDRDYQFLAKQDELLTQEILSVLRDITALEVLGNRNRTTQRRATDFDPRLLALRSEATALQMKQFEIRTQAEGLITQANNLSAYQARVAADFERRTGEIVKQQNQMAQWTARAKIRKRKVAEDQKTARVKPRRPRKVTYRDLLSFDTKQERDQLLHSLVPNVDEKQNK